jgi:hypothetical protein
VLRVWVNYAELFQDGKFKQYKAGVADARKLWEKINKTDAIKSDPYLKYFEGPLLVHELLALRYEMTEEIYAFYDKAAAVQYTDRKAFAVLLDKAAKRLEAHLVDSKQIESYLRNGRRSLGFDKSTLNRMRATRGGIKELSAYIKHLKKSHRPLPVFQQLHNTFMEEFLTDWYGDREHEWADESPRFVRFSKTPMRATTAAVAKAAKETGD